MLVLLQIHSPVLNRKLPECCISFTANSEGGVGWIGQERLCGRRWALHPSDLAFHGFV